MLESLRDAGVTVPAVPIIADAADPKTMRMVFERHRPQVAFHAGARKHVPLMQDNPREALRASAFGTWNMAALAGLFGAERFVMISTDKAAPPSVMGGNKASGGAPSFCGALAISCKPAALPRDLATC